MIANPNPSLRPDKPIRAKSVDLRVENVRVTAHTVGTIGPELSAVHAATKCRAFGVRAWAGCYAVFVNSHGCVDVMANYTIDAERAHKKRPKDFVRAYNHAVGTSKRVIASDVATIACHIEAHLANFAEQAK